jgi:hypothetical protein
LGGFEEIYPDFARVSRNPALVGCRADRTERIGRRCAGDLRSTVEQSVGCGAALRVGRHRTKGPCGGQQCAQGLHFDVPRSLGGDPIWATRGNARIRWIHAWGVVEPGGSMDRLLRRARAHWGSDRACSNSVAGGWRRLVRRESHRDVRQLRRKLSMSASSDSS